MSEKNLAINGGTPIRTEPWPGRIQIDDREINAVMELMEAAKEGGAFDRYAGEQVDTYEEEFADHVGTKYATAVSHGTAAVHSALGALRLDAGSEIICSPITDTGAVVPVVWNNCIPVFADAYEDNLNMDPATIPPLLTDQTKAIVCGHISGQPCDMDEIMNIAEDHDLYVIEDCAQSHDAEYKGKKAGSIGHLGAFSTMSGKHTTSGGQGGMVVTDDEELYWNAKRFADRGKPFNSDIGSNIFLGINYRVTELAAAVGRVQLSKMSDICRRRQEFVAAFYEALDDEDVVCVEPSREIEGAKSAYWFGTLFFHAERCAKTKAEYGEAIGAEGVPGMGSYPAIVPKQHWLAELNTYGDTKEPWSSPHWHGNVEDVDYPNSVPRAEKAVENLLRFGVHECLGEQEAQDLAAAVAKVDAAYRK